MIDSWILLWVWITEKKTHDDQVKSEVKSKDVEGLFKVLEDERGVLSTKTDNDDDTADAPNDDTADIPKDNTADAPNATRTDADAPDDPRL